MYQIVYTSSATALFGKEELVQLLEVSRANNSQQQITGMLVYKGGNFLQVLEGPEAAVKETYNRILRDTRHKGSITLLQGSKEERDFPEWTMGFRDIASTDLAELEGFNQFMNEPAAQGAADPKLSRAMKLLKSFKKSM